MYGDIKSQILTLFPFSNDATLILMGLLVWLISGLVFRIPMSRLSSVVPVIIISVAMEIADVVFLAQAPIRALSDFAMFVVPVGVIVFFQHQGWVRS